MSAPSTDLVVNRTEPSADGAEATAERVITYAEAVREALAEAMEADERVFLLGEDIADPGASGPTAGLSTKYGHERVLDTPISEAAILGAAVGAAIDGLLPVAEIMIMDFIGIAADQLINNAAKLRFMTAGRTTAPLTVRTQVYGGLATGATHSQTLEAWFMHIPGMKVIVPSTPRDGKGLLTSAIFDEDPCLFVETIRLQGQKGLVPTDPGFSIPLGRADVKRPGSDVTIISYGRSVLDSLKAAATLQEQGIGAEVIDLRTLLPLDVDTIVESVGRTRRAVVVHDAVQFAGPGAEIVATLQAECFSELVAPIERVGARFVPTPAAAALEAEVYPSPARVVAAVQRTLQEARVRG
jgi:acetoin:2,6-dichlorophenolindophenol oxidoreductase subunit beta